jgi:hypothetical protein
VKTWAQFFPFIEPEVMGCPAALIEHHLRQAARDFCRRSKAWREWVDAVTADGVTNTFDYDLASGQELVAITRALINDRPLTVTAGRDLPDDWQETVPTLTWKDTLVHLTNEQYMVFPMPDAADVLRLEMAFMPTQASTGIGDIVFDEWADELATGCKARLWAMKGHDWAATDLALDARQRFEGYIARAANRAMARRDVRGLRTKKAPL